MNAWEWFVTIGAVAGIGAMFAFGALAVMALCEAAGKDTPTPDEE